MPPVQGQLEAVVGELQAARRRLHTLRDTLTCDAWQRRPEAGRWSGAECVAHLNLTSRALVPLIQAGVREARDRALPASRYRRDPIGWLIWKAIAPSGGVRTKTPEAFVPSAEARLESITEEFEQLQSEIIACVRSADGLPIDRVKVVSPFDPRVRYNLYSALTMVPRHQHRHLGQAEHAARVTAPAASALAV
jgi:hypothetical protein